MALEEERERVFSKSVTLLSLIERTCHEQFDEEECLKRNEKLHIQDMARECEMPGRRRRKT